MTDDTLSPQIDIIYEDSSETIFKSKRLNYEKVKELYTEAQSIRVELNKSQSEEIRARLDDFIDEIQKLQKSSSKYLNSDEVMSDIDWIIEYAQAEKLNDVARWLCNLDSSLREMWSQYIEQIIALKK
jgi:t-SNARE complex subunit (syntaxin)